MSRRPEPPSAPGPLAEWIRRFGGVEPGDGGLGSGELADGGLRALREALARPGRDREGAYALLAADALLTRAARELAGEEDPETVLEGLIRRVAEEGAGG